MDIVTHAVSGIAVSSVVINVVKEKQLKTTGLILLFGALGAITPDVDVISLWSGFDATFGHLFNLKTTGNQIYFSKLWYSHHGFFHSIFAALIFTGIVIGLFSFVKKKRTWSGFINRNISVRWYAISFFLGYLVHLFGDIPTPSSTWGGVRMLWPSSTYIGGTGDIWWWNNYDIFLLFALCAFCNIAVYVTGVFIRYKQGIIATFAWIVTVLLINIQIVSRPIDFDYSGHSPRFKEMERQSKVIQQKILGDQLFRYMTKFDNKIGLNF